MKDMKINSVKLINGGSKGIEVKYALPNNKDNRSFIDEHTSKKKSPVHSELEETFSWLKEHLLEICGYSKDHRKTDLELVSMTSVKYSDKGFILKGERSVPSGFITLETPLISDDSEYEFFGKVISILNGVYEETKSYMSGDKTFSDTQLVLKFKANDKDFDAESFKSLSAEEQRDFATSILEQMGSLIIHSEEVIEEGEEEVEPFVFDAPIKEEVIEAPVVEEKAPAVQLIKEEGDEFSIVMTPLSGDKSTAKKKVKVA